MNLQDQEVLEIASLKESIGYKLVLDRIQCELDILQQEILDSSTAVNQEQVLFWRALYKIYYVLKVTPDQMGEEMKRLRTDMQFNHEQSQLQQVPKEYMELLVKEYLKRKTNKK